jgi:hypothetical protein
MKLFSKISLAAVALLFFVGSVANAQSLKSVFSDSQFPIVYLGIDFTKAKLLDNGNPNDIRDRLYSSINQLIVNEPKKFDLNAAFRKGNVEHDLTAVTKNYANINLNDIISTNSGDYNRLKEADIAAVVKNLDLSGKEGVGFLFVMEAMKKIDKKGEAAIWVTFIDMKTKKVLMTERIESKASMAIGFRNYWASTIKRLIDDIEDKKYNEWKSKYSS